MTNLAKQMSFLKDIFDRLETAHDTVVLQELRDGQTVAVTGRDLLEMVAKTRNFLASQGLKEGDRCALLAHNSIRWVAMDLAIMAEGLIVVPLYARQAPAELIAMMKDCSTALICYGDAGLRDGIIQQWPNAPPQFLCGEFFFGSTGEATEGPELSRAMAPAPHNRIGDSDPVTIIYTSGTSGEAKG